MLQRLYPDYRAMTYFSMEIDHLDYYDLTPTPPILRHYDKVSGHQFPVSSFFALNRFETENNGINCT